MSILWLRLGKQLDNTTILKFYNGATLMYCKPEVDQASSTTQQTLATASPEQILYNTVISIVVSAILILVFITMIVLVTLFSGEETLKRDSLLELFKQMKKEDKQRGSHIIEGLPALYDIHSAYKLVTFSTYIVTILLV